ncbi:MAG: hypothetical protein ACKO7N_01045 [Candidatus Nitrosotenuis sp.]
MDIDTRHQHNIWDETRNNKSGTSFNITQTLFAQISAAVNIINIIGYLAHFYARRKTSRAKTYFHALPLLFWPQSRQENLTSL